MEPGATDPKEGGMSREYRVQLDTVYGETDPSETLEDVLRTIVGSRDVSASVVVESGPAGGWPVVEYRGSREDLAEVIRQYGFDEAEAQELLAS